MTTEIQFQPISPATVNGINLACEAVHDWAKKKGWWDQPRNKGELIALMHSELSECLEFLRAKPSPVCRECGAHLEPDPSDKYSWDCRAPGCRNHFLLTDGDLAAKDDKVPELTGEAAELADTVIRIFDYCGAYGIDLGAAIQKKHEFNITRPQKHGGKKF